MSTHCYQCGKVIEPTNFGRQDSCDCGRDTRCCRNCKHYDKNYNNECREEQAGRQVDKEKRNFCEWFGPRDGGAPGSVGPTKDQLKSAAENLFKKKS